MRISVHYLAKIAFPLLLSAFALGYLATIEDAPRAARLFPDSLIWLLTAGCAVEIVRATYRQWARGDGEPAEVTLGPAQLGVVLAMALFYPAVQLLGFGIPSLLFLLAVSLLCGASLKQAVKVTLFAGLGLYAFFRATGFDLPIF